MAGSVDVGTAQAAGAGSLPAPLVAPPAVSAAAAAAASAAAAATATTAAAAAPAATSAINLGGRALTGSRELWLLRTLAVRRLAEAQILPALPSFALDEDFLEAVMRRIWRFLDDRPKFVASGCADGLGRVFDLSASKMLVSVRHDFSSRQALGAVLLLRPGPQLLTTTWDGKWHTWEEWPQKPSRPDEFARGEKGVGHENNIAGLAVSRDGNTLACACTIGCALVYRAECPTIEVEVSDPEEIEVLRDALKMGDYSELYLTESIRLGGVLLEENTALLKEASFQGLQTRRDLTTKMQLPAKLRFRFAGCLTRGHKRAWRKLEHDAAVHCLALIAEGPGEFLYTGSRDRTARKWDLADGHLVHTYTGHTSMVRCIAVNGTFLATGSDDRSIKVWQKDRPACVRDLRGHSDFVRALALCGTFQERLASAGDDFKVFLWDACTGERLREYAHASVVFAIALHESLLLSAADDRKLRVWRTETATCEQQLRHPGAVTALSLL